MTVTSAPYLTNEALAARLTKMREQPRFHSHAEQDEFLAEAAERLALYGQAAAQWHTQAQDLRRATHTEGLSATAAAADVAAAAVLSACATTITDRNARAQFLRDQRATQAQPEHEGGSNVSP